MLDYLNNIVGGVNKNLMSNGITPKPPTTFKSIWSHLGDSALRGGGLKGGLLSFAGERAQGGTPVNIPGRSQLVGFDGGASTGGNSNLKQVGGAVAGKALSGLLGSL